MAVAVVSGSSNDRVSNGVQCPALEVSVGEMMGTMVSS